MENFTNKIAQIEKKLFEYLPQNPEIELDTQQLPKLIRKIYNDYSRKLFHETVEESLVLDSVILLSLLACSKRLKIASPVGLADTYPNFYLIRLMPSSYGKDSTLNAMIPDLFGSFKEHLEEEYADFLMDYEDRPYKYLPRLKQRLKKEAIMEIQGQETPWFTDPALDPKEIEKQMEKLYKQMPEAKKQQILTDNTLYDFDFELSNATAEGLASYLESLHMFKKGCAFLRYSEFGSYITSGNTEEHKKLLTSLLTAWEGRPINLKKLKKNKTSVQDVSVPTVVVGNSSAFWVKSDKDRETFFKFINGGYGRRFFIFQPDRVFSKLKETITLEEEEKLLETDLHEYVRPVKEKLQKEIFDLYKSDTNYITWTIEARKLFNSYRMLNSYKADLNTTKGQENHPIASELKGRAEVSIKMAGLFAFLDKKKQITTTHMGQAIYFMEKFRYYALKLISQQYQTETNTQKLFAFLKETRSREQIKSQNYVPQGLFHKEFHSLMEEAKQYALTQGCYIEEKVGPRGARLFTTKVLPEVYEQKITLMVAPKQSLEKINKNTKYTPLETTWEDLHNVCKEYAYMPQLSDGGRKNDQMITGGVLLGLDVDDGWKLKEAQKFLEKRKIKSLLITTLSHQKDKDKKDGKKIPKRDRFRILVLLKYPFQGTPDDWKQMYTNLRKDWESQGAQLDDTSDMSRSFYPSPEGAEHVYIEGQPLDWIKYDYKPEQPKSTTNYSSRRDDYTGNAIEYVNKKYGGQIPKGNRDNALNEIFYAQVKRGASQDQARQVIEVINDKYCEERLKVDMRKFKT